MRDERAWHLVWPELKDTKPQRFLENENHEMSC